MAISLDKTDRPVRFARGKKLKLHDDPAVDRLMAMVAALSSELAIVRERLDTHERLAERRGLYTMADIEAYQPDAAAGAARQALRQRQIRKVFRAVAEDVARAQAQADEGGYEAVVEELEQAAPMRRAAGGAT